MMIRPSHYGGSRKAYVYTAYVLLAPFLIAALYFKFFPDELVSESVHNSIVLEVNKLEGSGVGSNSSMVIVQLDTGERSRLLFKMAPHVGQQVKVNVMKYESGEIDISPMREF